MLLQCDWSQQLRSTTSPVVDYAVGRRQRADAPGLDKLTWRGEWIEGRSGKAGVARGVCEVLATLHTDSWGAADGDGCRERSFPCHLAAPEPDDLPRVSTIALCAGGAGSAWANAVSNLTVGANPATAGSRRAIDEVAQRRKRAQTVHWLVRLTGPVGSDSKSRTRCMSSRTVRRRKSRTAKSIRKVSAQMLSTCVSRLACRSRLATSARERVRGRATGRRPGLAQSRCRPRATWRRQAKR